MQQLTTESHFAQMKLLAETLQSTLRRTLEDRDGLRAEKALVDQRLELAEKSLAATNRRPEMVPGPAHVQAPEAIRVRDQHILYLQYEVSQRDLQLQQLNQELEQRRLLIDGLEGQEKLLQEELLLAKTRVSQSQNENDALRLSIDSQLKRAEEQQKRGSTNHEMTSAREEIQELVVENRKLRDTSRELESELRDATAQIESVTVEHIQLKGDIDKALRINEVIRGENAKLRSKSVTQRDVVLQTQLDSLESSTAQNQLDVLIDVVNKRVDEWKEMINQDRESQRGNGTERKRPVQQTNDKAMAQMNHLLHLRNQEIGVLRSSLLSAVHELEEGADAINAYKKQQPSHNRETEEVLKVKLEQKVVEISNILKRVMALEDDLEVCNRENKDLRLQVKQFVEGTYGLSEATTEIRDLKNQLTVSDNYVKNLVSRMNKLTADYDILFTECNDFRLREGIELRLRSSKNGVSDVAGVLNNNLLVEVLQRQIDHLEEERASLKKAVRSLVRANPVSDDDSITTITQKTPSASPRFIGGKHVEGQRDNGDNQAYLEYIDYLQQEIESLKENNEQLEFSMREILDAIRASRFRRRPGEDVEIRVPSLEKLVSIMERRQGSKGTESIAPDQLRDDSAFYSETDLADSHSPSPFAPKVEYILDLLTIARQDSLGNETHIEFNFSLQLLNLVNQFVQVCLQYVTQPHSADLEEVLKDRQQQIQGVIDNSVLFHQNTVNIEKQKSHVLREENTALRQEVVSTQENIRRLQKNMNAGNDSLTMEMSEIDLANRLEDLRVQVSVFDTERLAMQNQMQLRDKQIESYGVEYSEGLSGLEQDHRNEVATLSRINADLRDDIGRLENHVSSLRASLHLANLYLADLLLERSSKTVEAASIKTSSVDDLPQNLPLVEHTGTQEQKETFDQHRVVAVLEAQILRLRNELKVREEISQKERDELIAIMTNSGKGLQTDVELNRQIAVLNSELGQKDRRIEVLSQQLEVTIADLQNSSENSLRREDEIRRETENVVRQYESIITKLREEVGKLKASGAISVLNNPDSDRTYNIPVPEPGEEHQPDQHGDSRVVEKLKAQIVEKNKEIYNISHAFQQFRDEMAKLPKPDKAVVDQLVSQKTEIQNLLDITAENNKKLATETQRLKTDKNKFATELEDLRNDTKRKDMQLRRFQTENNELKQRIMDLEGPAQHRKKEPNKKATDDSDDSVQLLKEKVNELEKTIARSTTAEKPGTGSKPEVVVWEERKKWEKTVEKLKERLKEKDSLLETVQQSENIAKEGFARSERDRRAMEKKIALFTKQISDLTQKPIVLQKQLDDLNKEKEQLETVLEKYFSEAKEHEQTQALLQARESEQLVMLDDMDHKYRKSLLLAEKVLSDNKMLKQKLENEITQEQDVQWLRSRIVDLETVIGHVKLSFPETALELHPEEIPKAVGTMKSVMDDQQNELLRVKRQNATLKARMKQIVESKVYEERSSSLLTIYDDPPRHEKQLCSSSSATQTALNTVSFAESPNVKKEDSSVPHSVPLSEFHRLKNMLDERNDEITRLQKLVGQSSSREVNELKALRHVYENSGKRILELEIQLTNILGAPNPDPKSSVYMQRQRV